MIEKVFSNANMNQAMEIMLSKKDTRGYDGLYVHDLPKYLSMNRKALRDSLLGGTWEPGYVQQYETVNRHGKIRIVSNLSTIDKFVSQCIYQTISPLINERMTETSYAYQKGKSVLDAAKKCRDYVSLGYKYVLHLDIHDFFGSLDTGLLRKKLIDLLNDRKLAELIIKLVQCDVVLNHTVKHCDNGVIEGSPLSPCLSNLYLSDFDQMMKESKLMFVRYSDDIKLFGVSLEELLDLEKNLSQQLENRWKLSVNIQKTKAEGAEESKYFGFSLRKQDGNYVLRKGRKDPDTWYREWTPNALSFNDGQYHILQEGILSRKDLTILFENDDFKNFFPVNTVTDLNVYGHEIYSSGFFEYMNEKKIQVHMFNDHGEPVGSFISDQYESDASLLILQVKAYTDPLRRLEIARSMELAQIRNIQSELRYYRRHKNVKEFDQAIGKIGQNIHALKKAGNINELLLIEGRSREIYYHCFNFMIDTPGFSFTERIRRPPGDPVNAMISFGNTFLYNRITSLICRTKLDNRISFVHSSERRRANLCYDLADIYKPLIVDPVIFALINRHQIDAAEHFEIDAKNNGVYLTREGCILFVRALKNKLTSHIRVGDQQKTYMTIIREDIYALIRALQNNNSYEPFSRKS